MYALRELALRLGLSLRLVDASAQPDLLYTGGDPPDRPARAAVRLDETLFAPATKCQGVADRSNVLWVQEGAAPDAHDPIGAVYRLLTLLDEYHVPDEQRDRRGIFLDTALPPARLQTAAVPLVEHQARSLWGRLVAAGLRAGSPPLAIWPGGKRIAVALTHDVDALHLGAAVELAANLAKGILRFDRRHLALFGVGLGYLGRFRTNPYVGFRSWQAWEQARDSRSAFYLFVRRPGVRHDPHDCRSSVDTQPVDWSELRDMVDQGWEMGLHASINSGRRAESLGEARRWLEERLERPVGGLRHHYLSLDWYRPHLTFRRQVDAGFVYDTSIGWRNRAGFRAGTCFPYEPFDPVAGGPVPLIELPLTAMDNHLAGRGVHEGKRVGLADRLAEGLAAVREVRDVGGVAVLNWHQEVIWDRLVYQGSVAALATLLDALADGGDAWVATPSEVASYWRERSDRLLPRGSGFDVGDR